MVAVHEKIEKEFQFLIGRLQTLDILFLF